MLFSIALSVATPFLSSLARNAPVAHVGPTTQEQLQAGSDFYREHSHDKADDIGQFIVDNKKGQLFSSGFINAAINADPEKKNVKFVSIVASSASHPVDNGMGYDQSNGPFPSYKEIFNYNPQTLFRMIYIVATTANHFGPFPLYYDTMTSEDKTELRSLIDRQQRCRTEEQRTQIHAEFYNLMRKYIANEINDGAEYYKAHSTDSASASASYIVSQELGQEFASAFVKAAIAADPEKKNVKFVDAFCSEVSYPAEASIGYKRSNGPFPAYEEIFNYDSTILFRMIYVTATTQGTMAYLPLWHEENRRHLTEVDKDELRELVRRQQKGRTEDDRSQIHEEFHDLLHRYISLSKL